MDGLRWLLLLFGLLLIAGVYAYSRRQGNKDNVKSAGPKRQEPSLHDAGSSSGTEAGNDAAEKAIVAEKIITLRLVARAKDAFRGDELVLNLRGIGMRHGKFGIFHRYEGTDDDNPVFSVASLVEPGSFDLANIKDQLIPGVSMFMVLPGPIEGIKAFDLLMAAARALAQSLHAELLDESGSTLSIQRERYLREEIIQYQHGIMVA